MSINTDQSVIGRSEKADFPALGLKNVPLKIDTGAYSSAIHCSSIEVKSDERLHVVFLNEDEEGYTGETKKFRNFRTRNIKSSSGHSETRYAIITKVQLGEELYKIRLTLTDRSSMRFPVLIGRRFLKRHKFVVDPNAINTIT